MNNLEHIQARLSDLGVIAISVTLAPDAKDMPLQEIKMSVATFINSYLDGKTKPVALLDVEAVQDLVNRDGITLDKAKAKYDNVVLKTEPQPAVLRLKRKYVKKDKPIAGIPEGWPFPIHVKLPDKPNKPEDALL